MLRHQARPSPLRARQRWDRGASAPGSPQESLGARASRAQERLGFSPPQESEQEFLLALLRDRSRERKYIASLQEQIDHPSPRGEYSHVTIDGPAVIQLGSLSPLKPEPDASTCKTTNDLLAGASAISGGDEYVTEVQDRAREGGSQGLSQVLRQQGATSSTATIF